MEKPGTPQNATAMDSFPPSSPPYSSPSVTPVAPPSAQAAASTHLSKLGSTGKEKAALVNVFAERFPPFDHEQLFTKPFEQEDLNDVQFEQDLSAILLELLLETHAWASARPKHERELALQRYEKEITEIIKTEAAQESKRVLVDTHNPPLKWAWWMMIVENARVIFHRCVSDIKNALAGLSGLAQ